MLLTQAPIRVVSGKSRRSWRKPPSHSARRLMAFLRIALPIILVPAIGVASVLVFDKL